MTERRPDQSSVAMCRITSWARLLDPLAVTREEPMGQSPLRFDPEDAEMASFQQPSGDQTQTRDGSSGGTRTAPGVERVDRHL